MISPMLWRSLLYNYNPLQIALSVVLDHVNFKIILYLTATHFVNFIFPVLSLSLNAYSSVCMGKMLAEWCDVQLFSRAGNTSVTLITYNTYTLQSTCKRTNLVC